MSNSARGMVAVATLLIAMSVAAQEERSQTDPTAAWWYFGQTGEQVNQLVTANNARLVSLKVQQVSPTYLFTVSMVANAGPYAKTWYWYYGVTADQLVANIADQNLRIIDLEPYDAGGGEIRFAAVLVANTGAESKAWWWYVNATESDVGNYLAQNNARLVDIAPYLVNGELRYSVVMIENSGADQKGWWWYIHVQPGDISTYLQTNNARLIALESEPTGGYAVIMESCACPSWWYYYGLSASQVDTFLAQNGARLVDIESYLSFPTFETRFNVVLINNSNPLTSRVGELLRSATSAPTGLYVKRVGGPVLGALQERYIFEPASTIKALIHLRAMLDVQDGTRALTDEIVHYVFTAQNTTCPSDANAQAQGTEPLSTALKEMMRRSDNPRTRQVLETVGVQRVNDLAQAIGMTSSHIDQTLLGCGAPPFNQLTLVDAGLLYEGVADGTLLSGTDRDSFYYLMAGTEMLAEDGYDYPQLWPEIMRIVDEEAPAALSASDKQAFLDQIRENTKAGGYSCITSSCLYYTSIAGWAQIPFCIDSTVVPQQYVFGLFVDGAASQAAVDAGFGVRGELLREQLQSALTDWAPCAATPTPVPCVGDCSGDGKVSINELVVIVNIALGLADPPDCIAADADGSDSIEINEIVSAVGHDLNGC